jgi:hypothetical protein
MTFCGFIVRGGNAFIWGDSERYQGGKPMRYPIEKVAMSAGGGIAAVATGHSPVTAEVRRLVTGGSASFADALRALPARLRQACAGEHARCHALGAAYHRVRSDLQLVRDAAG